MLRTIQETKRETRKESLIMIGSSLIIILSTIHYYGRFPFTQDLSERAQPLADEELATEIYDLVAECASNKQIKKGAN